MNVAHIGQSRPDSGFGIEAEVLRKSLFARKRWCRVPESMCVQGTAGGAFSRVHQAEHERGTHKTVKARFWLWLPGKSFEEVPLRSEAVVSRP